MKKLIPIIFALLSFSSCRTKMTAPIGQLAFLSAETVEGITVNSWVHPVEEFNTCYLNVHIKDDVYDKYYENDEYHTRWRSYLQYTVLQIEHNGSGHGVSDDDGNFYWDADAYGVYYRKDQSDWFTAKRNFLETLDLRKILGSTDGFAACHYMGIKSIDLYCTNSELFGRPISSSLADKFVYKRYNVFSYPDFGRVETPNGILLSEIDKYSVMPINSDLKLWPTFKISKEEFAKLNFKIVMVVEDEFYGERTFEAEYISE